MSISCDDGGERHMRVDRMIDELREAQLAAWPIGRLCSSGSGCDGLGPRLFPSAQRGSFR